MRPGIKSEKLTGRVKTGLGHTVEKLASDHERLKAQVQNLQTTSKEKPHKAPINVTVHVEREPSPITPITPSPSAPPGVKGIQEQSTPLSMTKATPLTEISFEPLEGGQPDVPKSVLQIRGACGEGGVHPSVRAII